MRWLVLALVPACVKTDPKFCSKHADDPSCTTTDATQPDSALCYGGGDLPICLLVVPSGPFNVASNQMLSTSVDGNCDRIIAQTGTAPELCVHAATMISIDATLTVSGTRPLVLLATHDITISGLVDASSNSSGQLGPAANPSDCTISADGQDSANSGGGGGGGGSFGSVGGMGGDASNFASGGTAGAAVTTPPLRGGCRGGRGGLGLAGSTHAVGGDGGGAIYFVAGGAITITGTIDASGRGGDAGVVGNGGGGGGGGGAGGMIAFAATTTTIASTGVVYANGAGGGGGGGNQNGVGGNDPTSATLAAPGGNGGDINHGGTGGAGAAAAIPAMAGMKGQQGGGGGGGGGLGVIRVPAGPLMNSGQLSPMPTS